MPRYEAMLAYSICCYNDVEFEAADDDAAIAEAIRLHEAEAHNFQPEWESAHEQRIVTVDRIREDGEYVLVADDIDLDPHPLIDNAFTLLQAAKNLIALMDEVPTGECASVSYDQEDRCFARFEFAELRAAIDKCEGRCP